MGIIPGIFGSPHVHQELPKLRPGSAVYRRDLVARVEQHLAEINQAIGGLRPLVVLADLVFTDGPDHEPYSAAYAWERVDLKPRKRQRKAIMDDDAPEIWH